MLIEDSVSDNRLANWSQSFYGVGAWYNVLGPHWNSVTGYKNWIGKNTTDFVNRAHDHGLKVSVYPLCYLFTLSSFFPVRRPLLVGYPLQRLGVMVILAT